MWRHQYLDSLPNLCSVTKPSGLLNPKWLFKNQQLGSDLKLDLNHPNVLQLLSANCNGHHSFAQAYSGHQFGDYTPMLGDGRGVFIGERQNPEGHWHEIFLKGSGNTPYSRRGDGRASLRSCIREFLASEAMHHLNVPTTRALAVISSEDTVMREQPQTAAITVRTSPCHIRFGHFEYARWGIKDNSNSMQQLLNFTIEHHFPQFKCQPELRQQGYQAWFAEVVKRTAMLIAKWQSLGFTHGVMNTDNMSIIGETLDYGPFAFLDNYDEHFVSNSNDSDGRYAFNMQPGIALWNLQKLANTLDEVIDARAMQHTLAQFQRLLVSAFLDHMCPRMGLNRSLDDLQLLDIIDTWRSLLMQTKLDYTGTMRLFGRYDGTNAAELWPQLAELVGFSSWLNKYQQATEAIDKYWRVKRDSHNPAVILRNSYIEQAIAAAQQDNSQALEDIYLAIKQPFVEPKHAPYLSQAPQAFMQRF